MMLPTLYIPALVLIGVTFGSLFYAGSLLMRLVLVQAVDEHKSRSCFCTVFAFAITLLIFIILDTASDSGHLQAAFNFIIRLFHNSSLVAHVVNQLYLPFNPRLRLFQWLLLSLEMTVMVACPAVLLSLVTRSMSHAQRRAALMQRGTGSGGTGAVGLSRRRRLRRLVVWVVLLAGLGYFLWQGVAVDSTDGTRSFSLQNVQAPAAMQEAYQKAKDAVRTSVKRTAELNLPQEVQPHNTGDEGEDDMGPEQWAAMTPSQRAAAVERRYERTGGAEVGAARTRMMQRRAAARYKPRMLGRVLAVVTSRLAIVGVALMGLLAGYAAVMTPYNFLTPYVFYRGKATQLLQARGALSKKQRYVLGLYAAKQRRLAQEAYEAQNNVDAAQTSLTEMRGSGTGTDNGTHGEGTGGGLLRWLRAPFSGQSRRASVAVQAAARRNQETAKVRADCEGIRYLSLSLFLQMDELDRMIADAHRGERWVGKLYALLGVGLTLYSVTKVVLTVVSLVLFKLSTDDPVTRAVNLLERMLVLRQRNVMYEAAGFSVTAVSVSAHVIITLALLVNAWMILNSIRGLLLNIFHFTLSFSSVVTADTTAVGLSMMMGLYFIGQFVMLRQSLPTPSSGVHGYDSAHVLYATLGDLPVYYYQRLSDFSFLVGCVLTFVIRRFVLADPAMVSSGAVGGAGVMG